MNEITQWRGEIVSSPSRGVQKDDLHPFRQPDVVTIFNAIASNLRLIVFVTLFGAAAAYLVLRTLPQQFTASALIMLDTSNTLLDETENAFANLPIADSYIESEIELIRSDAIVHRVIEQENLLEDPEFAGGGIPDGIQQMIEARASLPDQREASEELRRNVTLFQVAKEVRERLNVERRGLSQGIEISFRSRSQEKARDLANAFAQSYVDDQLDNKLTASNRAMDWLKSELQTLSEETQIAEAKVEEYRARNTLVGEGEQGVGEQQLKLLTEKLSAARAAEADAEVTVEQLRDLRARGQSLLTIPEISENAQVQMLRAKLAEAEQAEAEMASLYNPEMRESIPPYQEVYSRRVAAETALNNEVARVVSEIETRLASARAVSRSLEQQLKTLRDENAELNEAAIGLNDLEREAEGKRQRYNTLLAEFNETNNTAATQTPHARIVSPAEMPLLPSSPNKKAAFGAAIVFFGALGVFLALLREFTRRAIRTPEELFAVMNLRPVGVLPRALGPLGKRKKALAATMNILTKAPQSDYAEAVRSLRTELFLIAGSANKGVFAITSPDTVRGKVAMAGSLARSMALTGTKTLFVDADIRRAEVLPKLYNSYDGPDLANVLRGYTDWREAIIVARNKNLSFLAARPGGWDEAVSHAFSGRFQSLVDEWREEFQMVVINAPPTCIYPEARAIATCVDKAILALEWNSTNRRLAIEAYDLLREVGCHPLVAMTNVARNRYRRWLKPGATRHSGKPRLNIVPAQAAE